jgi:hypothetical protein
MGRPPNCDCRCDSDPPGVCFPCDVPDPVSIQVDIPTTLVYESGVDEEGVCSFSTAYSNGFIDTEFQWHHPTLEDFHGVQTLPKVTGECVWRLQPFYGWLYRFTVGPGTAGSWPGEACQTGLEKVSAATDAEECSDWGVGGTTDESCTSTIGFGAKGFYYRDCVQVSVYFTVTLKVISSVLCWRLDVQPVGYSRARTANRNNPGAVPPYTKISDQYNTTTSNALQSFRDDVEDNCSADTPQNSECHIIYTKPVDCDEDFEGDPIVLDYNEDETKAFIGGTQEGHEWMKIEIPATIAISLVMP